MRKWKRILAVSGLCSCAFATPALASTNLETGSSLAGISVALNNFYAGNTEPEKQLATIYSDMETDLQRIREVVLAAIKVRLRVRVRLLRIQEPGRMHRRKPRPRRPRRRSPNHPHTIILLSPRSMGP